MRNTAGEDSRDGCNITSWPHEQASNSRYRLPEFFDDLKRKWYIALPEIYGMHASPDAKRMKPADWESNLKGAIVRVDFELYYRRITTTGDKNVFSPKLTLVQVIRRPYVPGANPSGVLKGPKGQESPRKRRRTDTITEN